MASTEQARKNHEVLFPGYVSTLAVTDPEFIAYFDNFAFDEVLGHGHLEPRTRLMVQLASMIAVPALRVPDDAGCGTDGRRHAGRD